MTTIPTVDNPKWTGNFADDSDEIILARALYGEARGEPRAGKIAVAWVIRNRKEHPRWWNSNTSTYLATITQPQQFACFNPTDQNLKYVQDPSLNFGIALEKAAWYECYEIAKKVIAGEIADNTLHADSFHSTAINPDWATQDKFTVQIGNHLFYRLELDAPIEPTPTPNPTPNPDPSPEPIPDPIIVGDRTTFTVYIPPNFDLELKLVRK